MATVETRQGESSQVESKRKTPRPAPRPPRRARWTRRFLICLACFAALAWFAPWILSRSPLVGYAVKQAAGELDGSAKVGGVSLGWLSPIELRDVEITDSAGRKLLAAPRIVTDKSLAELLGNLSELGTLTIERPAIHLATLENTTNAEHVFRKLLDAPAKPAKDPLAAPGIAVKIVDASLKIEDTAGKRTWEATGANVSLSLGKNWSSPLEVKATAGWSEEAGKEAPGKLDVALSLAQTPQPGV
jgi:hypothetical protein